MAHSVKSTTNVSPVARQKGIPTSVDLYFRDVSRRWKKATNGADRVVILSPYLTSGTAESVLRDAGGRKCEVYTIFQAENFASGASSIRTLLKLQRNGCDLYHLPDLHAKIVLVPGRFVSIGSQNITRRGRLNKEATCGFTKKNVENAIIQLIQPWLEERQPITPDMIDEIFQAIGPITDAMKTVQATCKALDETIWENEHLRADEREYIAEEERRQREAKLQEDEYRLKQDELRNFRLAKVERTKERLAQILQNESISWLTARMFIEGAMWWDNPLHGLIRSPGHRRHLEDCYGDWKIKLGSNSFNVTLAIVFCAINLKHWLERNAVESEPSLEKLRASLVQSISECVENSSGGLYARYPVDGDFMRFGTIWLNVKDFAECFLRSTGTLEEFEPERDS